MRRLVPLPLLAAALVACGGSSTPPPPAAPKLPHALARTWVQQAQAVAAAAAAGQSCQAQQLAAALRNEVIGAQARVPARLRGPLIASVNDLADRIACTPPPAAPPAPPPGPPGHGKGHGDHGRRGGGGDG